MRVVLAKLLGPPKDPVCRVGGSDSVLGRYGRKMAGRESGQPGHVAGHGGQVGGRWAVGGGGQGRGGTYLDQSGRRLLDAHIFFGGGAGRSGSLVIRRQGGWAGRRGRRRGRQDWRAARHVHGRLGGVQGMGWGWVSGWACEEGRRPTGGSISTLIPLGPVRGRGKDA